jgi:hypothetical protein
MTRVHSIEGYSGGTTPENYGGENDATYLCTPVRIVADTALEAIERATSVGEAMADVADRHPHAAWVTSPAEAAYALMASCVIALGQLPTTDRLAVRGAGERGPAIERRRGDGSPGRLPVPARCLISGAA